MTKSLRVRLRILLYWKCERWQNEKSTEKSVEESHTDTAGDERTWVSVGLHEMWVLHRICRNKKRTTV